MLVWGTQARKRAFDFATVFGGFSASLVAGGAIVSAHAAELSPAQTVAQRFPTAWNAAASTPSVPTTATPQAAKPATVSTRGIAPAESTRGISAPESTRGVTAAAATRPTSPVAAALATAQVHPADLYFNPNPTGQPALAARASASLPSAVLAYAEPAAPASAPAAAKPAYQLASASAVPEKRSEPHRAAQAARSNFVFSDGQIASMKERLNLTASQERMWPQVEVALRGLVYQKPAPGEKKTAAARTLDPQSPEVARLKSVAVPLVLSFDSEQRRELRSLAHVVGLDNLVMNF